MIVEMGYTSNEVWNCFSVIEPMLEMYRDAQSTPPDFRLEVIDCWRGLELANVLGWVEGTDMDEYEHYNNPLEGDLHAIIPDKLIAFRGPVELQPPKEYADVGGVRFFAPSFYAQPFVDLGITLVIRLNARAYDPAPLEAAGIRCVHIDLDEGTIPPPAAVVAFLDALASCEGAVAVHCKEGLGRTGTLAAVHLMVAHGFSAREAMGWIRVVRPGSIVGPQQQFLCRLGEGLDAHGRDPAGVRAAALSIAQDDSSSSDTSSEDEEDRCAGRTRRRGSSEEPPLRRPRPLRRRPTSDV